MLIKLHEGIEAFEREAKARTFIVVPQHVVEGMGGDLLRKLATKHGMPILVRNTITSRIYEPMITEEETE